jgi:hypothetical protein
LGSFSNGFFLPGREEFFRVGVVEGFTLAGRCVRRIVENTTDTGHADRLARNLCLWSKRFGEISRIADQNENRGNVLYPSHFPGGGA